MNIGDDEGIMRKVLAFQGIDPDMAAPDEEHNAEDIGREMVLCPHLLNRIRLNLLWSTSRNILKMSLPCASATPYINIHTTTGVAWTNLISDVQF